MLMHFFLLLLQYQHPTQTISLKPEKQKAISLEISFSLIRSTFNHLVILEKARLFFFLAEQLCIFKGAFTITILTELILS